MISRWGKQYLGKMGKIVLAAALVVTAFAAQLGAPKAQAAGSADPFSAFYLLTHSNGVGVPHTFHKFDTSTGLFSTDTLSVTTSSTSNSVFGKYTVSPDGQYIAYATEDAEFFFINTQTAVVKKAEVLNGSGNPDFNPSDVAFSPDGTKVVFVGYDTSGSYKARVVAFDMNDVLDPSVTVITPYLNETKNKPPASAVVAVGSSYYVGYSWAASGSSSAAVDYYDFSATPTEGTIQLANSTVSSGRVSQLQVSPDRTKIFAYNSMDQKIAVIDLQQEETTGVYALSHPDINGTARGSAISPDGSTLYVAYEAPATETNKGGVAAYDINDEFQLLESTTFADYAYNIGVSPDGASLLVHTINGSANDIVRLNSADLVKVSDNGSGTKTGSAFYGNIALNLPYQYQTSVPQPVLTGITLDKTLYEVETTKTVPVQVTATYSDGTTRTVTGATYSIDDTNVAVTKTVSSVQVIEGKNAGTAVLTVTYEGQTATADITVKQVESITVTPGTIYLNPGQQSTITVVKQYTDGQSETITDFSTVNMTSSSTNVATISNGVITAVAAGSSRIYVTYNGKSAFANVAVDSRTVDRITLDKTEYEIYAESHVGIQVTAHYTNGTSGLIGDSGTAEYLVSDTTIAKVSPSAPYQALRGYYEGSTLLTVTYGGKTVTADVIVNKKFHGISSTLSASSVEVGQTSVMTVTKEFYGGPSETFTEFSRVVFASDDTSIATIDSSGTITAVGVGSTYVSAEFNDGVPRRTQRYITVTNASGNPTPTTTPTTTPTSTPTSTPTPTPSLDPVVPTSTPAPTPTPTPSPDDADGGSSLIEFTDTNNHWAQSNIERGVELGLVKGFEDGSFRPDDTLTRGQFAVMLQRALGLEADGEYSFADREDIPQWAIEAVSAVSSEGYIVGYNDGTFRSDASITRTELAVIIARVLNATSEEKAPFLDASSIPAWAYKEISAIAELGLINGRSDGRFDAQGTATRAEALTILLRLIDYLQAE